MAPAALDAERVPRKYSTAVAIFCGLWLALVVVLSHGSAVTRSVWGVIFAVLICASYLLFRVQFRRTLAKPLPRRGINHWLVTLPGWIMVLAQLAYALAVLGLVIAVVSVTFRDPVTGFLLGGGPLFVIFALAEATAWLELRRRQAAASDERKADE